MKTNQEALNKLVAEARRSGELRERGYREQALKKYPHICGRCSREFTHSNLRELTVHHRDHNHDNNPSDGSNWELLCLYCHDNEHQKQIEAAQGMNSVEIIKKDAATFNPFSNIQDMFNSKKEK